MDLECSLDSVPDCCFTESLFHDLDQYHCHDCVVVPECCIEGTHANYLEFEELEVDYTELPYSLIAIKDGLDTFPSTINCE